MPVAGHAQAEPGPERPPAGRVPAAGPLVNFKIPRLNPEPEPPRQALGISTAGSSLATLLLRLGYCNAQGTGQYPIIGRVGV